MSTHPKIDQVCVAVLVCTLLLTILFMNGSALGIQMIIDEDSEAHSGSAYFTANDLDGAWDTSGAAVITLNGDSAKISGSGAYFYDGNIVIRNGGHYVLSGSLSEGSIIVDAYQSSKVWLMLDGVDLVCSDDACLRVDQADKVFVTLADGSQNTMSSGETYSAEALEDGTGGTIYSHDDLTINGSGSLSITAAYKHGIDANDKLVITGGNISIRSAEDALHANDEICLQGMDLTIDAGDDGISCGKAIVITGGSIRISQCYEGIEGLTIDISGGDIEICARDDGMNANGNSSFSLAFPHMSGNSADSSESTDEETWIHISGGSVTIINETATDADGLDSNGDILITGGTLRISLVNSGCNNALDYGSEAGGSCMITGGDVIGCGSYSMAEGFESGSTQCSVLYNISSGVEAGTTVALEDSDGNVLVSYEVPCSFSSLVLSSPEMQLGETYLIVIGDQAEEITLEDVAASYGDAQSSMFGGPMNWGGMQERGEFGGGRGGHLGRSGEGSGPAMQTSGDEIPEAPEGSMAPQFDGEMPEMPDGSMAPQFDGGMPEMPGGMDPFETETVSEESSGSGEFFTSEAWLLCGISAIILLAGILFASKYRIFR